MHRVQTNANWRLSTSQALASSSTISLPGLRVPGTTYSTRRAARGSGGCWREQGPWPGRPFARCSSTPSMKPSHGWCPLWARKGTAGNAAAGAGQAARELALARGCQQARRRSPRAKRPERPTRCCRQYPPRCPAFGQCTRHSRCRAASRCGFCLSRRGLPAGTRLAIRTKCGSRGTLPRPDVLPSPALRAAYRPACATARRRAARARRVPRPARPRQLPASACDPAQPGGTGTCGVWGTKQHPPAPWSESSAPSRRPPRLIRTTATQSARHIEPVGSSRSRSGISSPQPGHCHQVRWRCS